MALGERLCTQESRAEDGVELIPEHLRAACVQQAVFALRKEVFWVDQSVKKLFPNGR